MIDILALTLVHFLWQGAFIGAVAWVGLRLARGSASTQYAVGVAALALMCIAPVVTGRRLSAYPQPNPIVSSPALAGSTAGAPSSASTIGAIVQPPVPTRTSWLQQSLPSDLVVWVWFAGVVATTTRMAGGLWMARRLAVRGVRPVDAAIAAMVAGLRTEMGVGRHVDIRESALALTPMLIGWLRPVIVLPAAAIAGLTSAQLQAIVAHEIAHVRRHDYLVNVCQMVIESLLFFHPAVWWVSRRVREARELCCDDLVVQTNDRLTYAEALSRIAAAGLRPSVVAASGGHLRRRITRVLVPSPARNTGAAGILPLLLLIVAAFPISAAVQRPVLPIPSMPTTAVPAAPRGELPREVEPESPSKQAVGTTTIKAARVTISADSPSAPTVTLSGEVTLEVLPNGPTGTPDWLAALVSTSTQALVAQQATAPPSVEVTVTGLVLRPGTHQLDGAASLGRALERAGGTTIDAASVEVVVRRRLEDGRETQIVIAGTQLDIGNELLLRNGDVVLVRTPVDQAPRKVFTQAVFVNGEVLAPGLVEWQEGMTFSRALAIAGLKPSASAARSYIRRLVTKPDGTKEYLQIRSLKAETLLEPNDEVVVARKLIG